MSTPVEVGDTVYYIDEDENKHQAVVRSTMAVQMRVRVDGGYDHYVFYRDEGLTWKRG